MKRFAIIFFFFLSGPLWAVDRHVVSGGDSGDGTLRAALYDACRDAGNDEIRFAPARGGRFVIHLQTPLEIPEDCNGAVTLSGPTASDQEVILDGSGISSGDAILIVRSWGNTVERLTFVGYENGAGLSLAEGDNTVHENLFGVDLHSSPSPNRNGLLIAGDWNLIEGNTVTANLEDGIILEGNANAVESNRIGDVEGFCRSIVLPEEGADETPTFIREISHELSQKLMSNFLRRHGPQSDACGNGEAGVRISGDRNLVGGDELSKGNRILFNRGGGIVVSEGGLRNRFSRNVIAYNTGPGIKLDGTSAKGGANGGIQPIGLQSFPVEPDPTTAGPYRYTLFGTGVTGTRVELYLVAADEEDDSNGRGEGAKYLESFTVSGETFTQTLERTDVSPGSRISSIVCDGEGNCSEFSQNVALGRDSDHDGLTDPTEDGKSDPLLNDTDGDGLPDSVEDRNQNGRVDPGETDPTKADTDGDGISDFVETGGDGHYDPAEGDTDPTNPDTDGDGLMDGAEDLNHDGMIEMGETDPRNPDTNGDGVSD